MNKQAPSRGRILTMVAFAASCIGLLIFLWTSFGGSIPFAPQGYRIHIEFDEAVQLADQSDVRISGVSVGKVLSVALDHRTGLTRATIELDRQFAPRPADTRAILRAKSLLGETYVELTPGSRNGPQLPDGGTLPHGHVAPTVQLDKILSTFDPRTRRAFQVWMQQSAVALTKRGEDFNAAFAELYPFATNVDSVLVVLNRQSAATQALLRDGGQVFSAIGQSPAQLQGFIKNSNSVFAATAAQNAALAAAVKAFPAFTIATRLTIDRLTKFAQDTKPLIDELRPAARALDPDLEALPTLAPELKTLVVNVAPLTAASEKGFPALGEFLNESIPLLTRLKPYLGGVVPVINYINVYRREIAAFFANSTATTQGTLPSANGGLRNYVRISNPINPEVLAAYQHRLTTNRGNPYLQPGGYDQLLNGLPVFGSYLCTSVLLPTFGPSLSTTTTTVAGKVLTLAQLVQTYYYTADPGGPVCRSQAPLGTLTTGQPQAFPHLEPIP
jgi:phospholipid/cholesterol/gamma-HCH transport system substrate-binding protein